VIGSSGYLDLESVLESGHIVRERELIPKTQSSSNTLKGLNMYELTQTNAWDSVETPRSMSSIHRLAEVATEASSAVGEKTFSSEGAAITADGMMELETDSGGGASIPEVPPSLRGSVRFGSSEVAAPNMRK
jgi:hypothetical protein